MSGTPRKHTVIAILAATVGLGCVGSITFDSLRMIGEPFPGFFVWDNGVLPALHRTQWTGPQAELPVRGEVVETVDGAAFEGAAWLYEYVRSVPVGTPIHYGVREGRARVEYVVPSMPFEIADYAATLGLYLFDALALMVVGGFAYWLRPDLPAARALAISTGAGGLLLAFAVDYVAGARLPVATQLAEVLTPIALLNLACVLPVERVAPRWRIGVLSTAAAGLVAVRLAVYGTFRSDPELAYEIQMGTYLLVALALAVLVGNVVVTMVSARSPDDRRQAAVVAAGFVPAFLLPVAMLPGFILLDWSFSWTWAFATVPLAPVAVLYAIARYDLLASERFARLTVVYALTSAVALSGLAVGLFAFGRFVQPPGEPSAGIGFFELLIVAALFDPLRRRVQAGIDRAFYRSRVDPVQELERASEALVDLQDAREIRHHVERQLRDAMALEYVELSRATPPEDAAYTHRVEFRGESLGWLTCGPKRSGAPFSDAERELVGGLARQAALALRQAEAVEALHKAQQTLLRTERLAAIGEFAGAVAHGIRNPLATIRIAAEFAVLDSRDEVAADALGKVLEEIDRLDVRIRALLDFSRSYEPDLKPGLLSELIREVVTGLKPQADAAGIRIEAEVLPEEEPTVQFDPRHLEHALLEIGGNALHAMEPRGQLSFSLSFSAGGASIRVRDTGKGIPTSLRERVFEPFFTGRADGTGVGLAAVRRAIEEHAGSIEIEKSDTTGTTFLVTLPVERAY